MSSEGPESIPTSADPRSKRPTKKRALSPGSAQASHVEALFAKPDQHIRIPDPDAPSKRRNGYLPPEIVANVQGSSAGAGSGEFHVYKAARRREYERLRQMEQETAREKGQEEFEKKNEENKKKDEERTRKNKEKRDKAKARKAGKGKGKPGGNAGGGASATSGNAATSEQGGPKTKIAPRGNTERQGEEEEGDREQPGANSAGDATPAVQGIVFEED